jgi:hypothetical protein
VALLFLSAGLSFAQVSAQTSTLIPAQAPSIEIPTPTPVVDVLDFFGLSKIPEARIRKVLGFKEGDPFPPSKGDIEERLDAQPDIVESHLEAVCCDAGTAVSEARRTSICASSPRATSNFPRPSSPAIAISSTRLPPRRGAA